MFNAEQLLGELLGGAVSGGLGGRKRRRNSGGSLLGGLGASGKAQLGIGLLGVAMAAWDHYKNQAPAPSPAGGQPPMAPPAQYPVPGANTLPPPPPGAAPRAPAAAPSSAGQDQRTHDMVLLIQAMVAAAAADGQIDDTERGQILQRAADANLDAQAQAFLRAELDAPKSLLAIVSATRPELAPDVYAASCVAISLDTDAERSYLDTLATRLGISSDARQAIHAQVGMG
jgi:uncharacterized membrane protein YebE (DUF533 family)